MANRVYPIGYSAGGAQKRVEELMSDTKVLLIDTRLKPYSWRVEWKKEALQEKYGERYHWAGKVLGNRNYQGGPIDIANLAVGIRGLQMYLDEGYDLILLCECASFASCHRKVIVDKLLQVRPDVEVIQPPKPAGLTVESIQARCEKLSLVWSWFVETTLERSAEYAEYNEQDLALLNTALLKSEVRRMKPRKKVGKR